MIHSRVSMFYNNFIIIFKILRLASNNWTVNPILTGIRGNNSDQI